MEREVLLLLLPATLLLSGCKNGKDDLPANLTPASGETIRYSKVGSRCPVYVQKFKGADGAPAGATCVSHELLAAICRRATRCEQTALERKAPLIDRSKGVEPPGDERDR